MSSEALIDNTYHKNHSLNLQAESFYRAGGTTYMYHMYHIFIISSSFVNQFTQLYGNYFYILINERYQIVTKYNNLHSSSYLCFCYNSLKKILTDKSWVSLQYVSHRRLVASCYESKPLTVHVYPSYFVLLSELDKPTQMTILSACMHPSGESW